MTVIKPCPFCGGLAEVRQVFGDGRVWDIAVVCMECFAHGGSDHGVLSSTKDCDGVIQIWNKREEERK